jgi:hypothetical protein
MSSTGPIEVSSLAREGASTADGPHDTSGTAANDILSRCPAWIARPLAELRDLTRDGLPPLAMAAAIVGCVVAMIVARAVWGFARFPQIYSEPITGYMAWFDAGKLRDFIGLGVWIAGMIAIPPALFLGLARFVAAAPLERRGELTRAVTTLLWATLIPTVWWFGAAVMRDAFHNGLVPHDSAIALAVLLLAMHRLRSLRSELTEQSLLTLAGGLVVITFLGQFAGLGVETLLVKLQPDWTARLEKLRLVGPIVGCVLALAGGLVVLGRNSVSLAVSGLVRWSLLVQLPLLGLAWILIPHAVEFQGQILPPRHRATLHLLPLALAVWGIVSVVRRWRAGTESPRIDAILSTPCVASLVLFLWHIAAGNSQMLHPDHFHHGEQLLPYQQCVTLGLTPYVEFLPIHGLMPLTRGWLTAVFFDGTAVGFTESLQLLADIGVFVQFIAVAAITGPGIALLTGIPFLHLMDRFYFFIPALLLLSHSRVVSRPILWLWCWLGSAITLLAFNPCVGTAFDLGTFPLAIGMLAYAWFRQRRPLLFSVAVLALGGVLLAATTPAVEIVAGFIRFIRLNGAVSNPAHGMPWDVGLHLPEVTPPSHTISAPAFQILRLSWLGCAGLLAWLAANAWLTNHARRRELAWLAGLGIPSFLALIPWTMGRIDPGGMSRSGWFSILLLTSLVPVVLWMARTPRTLVPSLLSAALLGGLFSWPGFGPTLHRHVGKPFHIAQISWDRVLVDGPKEGLPGMGLITMSVAERDREFAFRDVIARFVEPDETFFDFSNMQARYAYLGKPAPALYTAVFHTASRAMQQQVWDQLAPNLPPVVILGPGETFGSGAVSLRSFGLFREFALRYIAIEVQGAALLIRPDRLPVDQRPTLDEQLAIWSKHMPVGDLCKLPQSWGRSWSRMSDEFTAVATLPAEGMLRGPTSDTPNGRTWTADLAALNLNGAAVDYLRFDLRPSRKPGGDSHLTLAWSTDRGPCETRLTMSSKQGPLLVPIGALPHWLRAARIESLTFSIDSPEPIDWTISGLTLLSREPLQTPTGVVLPPLLPGVPSAPVNAPSSLPATPGLAKEERPGATSR